MSKKIKLPATITGLPFRHPAEADLVSDGTGIYVEVTCAECGERFRRKVTLREAVDVLRTYRHGGFHPTGHVQDVFASWTAPERELYLMSHLCDGCWKTIMAPEDGYDE